MDDIGYDARAPLFQHALEASTVPAITRRLGSNPSETARLAGVRGLERSDIPQLCDLFVRTFRPGRKVRREDIEACFARIYLTSPGDLVRPASLVDVGPAGEVRGFMGIITLAARLGPRALRGGMMGNFMASEADRAKAALRLVRASIAQDLDFLFSDTANQTSLAIARAFKFDPLPIHSLSWVKILRPCGAASSMMARRSPVLGAALAPLARCGDAVARSSSLTSLPPLEAGIVDRPVAPSAFAIQAQTLMARFLLRPDWHETEFAWLFDQAHRKSRDGALHIREILDRNKKVIGLYLLYARAGDIAGVLQMLAEPGREDTVLGALIHHAAGLGTVAVKGQATPLIVRGLMRQPGIFYKHAAAAIVYTRQLDLRPAFLSEDAFLGGLMGESWTQLVADDFT